MNPDQKHQAEQEPWVDAKLRCGIGHMVSGRVRVVRDWHRDSEGRTGPDGLDGWWGEARDDYDPNRCVVCGLAIASRADNGDSL